jgi:hypothetical protein
VLIFGCGRIFTGVKIHQTSTYPSAQPMPDASEIKITQEHIKIKELEGKKGSFCHFCLPAGDYCSLMELRAAVPENALIWE